MATPFYLLIGSDTNLFVQPVAIDPAGNQQVHIDLKLNLKNAGMNFGNGKPAGHNSVDTKLNFQLILGQLFCFADGCENSLILCSDNI